MSLAGPLKVELLRALWQATSTVLGMSSLISAYPLPEINITRIIRKL